MDRSTGIRTRWAAFGAAIAVTIGGGAVGIARATISSGERAAFVPITPCRLFDTRPSDQVGPRSAPLGPGDTHTQQVTGANGNCTIPADATAVSMNVTVVQGTASSFLTLWPSDAPRPLASNLNWVPGSAPTPNKVDVKLSATGAVNVFNLDGTVHVLADVVGFYADHNHDDRYYEKSAVDAMIAEDGPIAWGMARADGSLRAQSPNVVEVLHPGTGLYCVVFDPPVTGSRLESAVISGSGSGPVMAEKTNGIGGYDSCTDAPGGLELRIYNESGALSDERFGFVVP